MLFNVYRCVSRKLFFNKFINFTRKGQEFCKKFGVTKKRKYTTLLSIMNKIKLFLSKISHLTLKKFGRIIQYSVSFEKHDNDYDFFNSYVVTDQFLNM